MNEKDLKINFRYLVGNIACMSVDSVSGKPVHNDINNEEAIILFNSLVGEKEGCQTVKTLLQEKQQLKSTLEEIREILNAIKPIYKGYIWYNNLLQIIDKGVNNEIKSRNVCKN